MFNCCSCENPSPLRTSTVVIKTEGIARYERIEVHTLPLAKLPPLAASAGASFVCVTSLKDFAVSVFVQNSSCIAPDCASQCLPEGRTSYSLGHYMLKRRPLTIVGFLQINSATVSHGPPGNNRCSQSRVMSLAASISITCPVKASRVTLASTSFHDGPSFADVRKHSDLRFILGQMKYVPLSPRFCSDD